MSGVIEKHSIIRTGIDGLNCCECGGSIELWRFENFHVQFHSAVGSDLASFVLHVLQIRESGTTDARVRCVRNDEHMQSLGLKRTGKRERYECNDLFHSTDPPSFL
jgi:hypothetical protein